MTDQTTTAPHPELPEHWQIPTLTEDARFFSGVSAALAEELGVDALWVRSAWILLFAAGGWGAFLYLIVWGALSWTGYRGLGADGPRQAKGRTVRSGRLGFGLLVVGLAGLFASFPALSQALLWPVALMALGTLVVWRRFGSQASAKPDGRYPMAQTLGGLVSIAVGAILVVFVALGATGIAVIFYLLIAVFVVVVAGTSPLWWKFLQKLEKDRQTKAVADERAVVNAHLHDSVLQTLALIQRNADDPQTMLNLARRQERELRNWLDPDRASRLGGSVRGYLDDMTTELEELYGTPVEVVAVGDCLIEPALEHTLAAAREAVVNAAKHSGAEQIDIYVEVSDDRLELFVRDRGVGFDPSAVASDRRGLRESIEARMVRVGGTATIHSQPGEGTEVELSVPRSAQATQSSTSTAEDGLGL